MFKKILFSFVSMVLVAPCLFAFSIGKDGSPYWDHDVLWQPVSCEDSNFGFNGAVPGYQKSGLSDGYLFVYGEDQSVIYSIFVDFNAFVKPSKNEKEFIQEMKDVFGHEADIVSVRSNQKKVKYIADVYFKNEPTVMRFICSSNKLYIAGVSGDDLSLAPIFFEKIVITK